jgi:hypothetical protein
VFAKLRALAEQTDFMTIAAIAAVGWGIAQLTKTVEDRQSSVMALTAKAGQVASQLAAREQQLAAAEQRLEAIRSQETGSYPTADDTNPLRSSEG